MRTSVLSLALAAALLAGCGKDQPPPLADAGPPPPAPTVTSIDPASGPKSGATVVSVLGTGFADGAKLFLGSVEATQVTVVSDRRLTGTSPLSPASGLVDVKVVNPDGQSGVLPQGFRFIPPPSERTEVDSCQLLSPQALTVSEGSYSQDVVGTVTAIGVTDVPGQGPAISGELGYGPADAGVDTSAWTWITANYDDGRSGSTFDAYSGKVPGPTRGDYLYGYRFRYDGGSWTYCDLNGSDIGGFTADQVGRMTVIGPQVDWCATTQPQQLTSAPGKLALGPDGGTQIFGEAYRAAGAYGTTTDDGTNQALYSAQVGYGPADAGAESSAWVWGDATFQSAHAGKYGNDYQWTGQITGPSVAGAYSFGYRLKLDGGSWVYCGSGGLVSAGATSGFGTLQATGASTATVNYCVVETATANTTAGQPTPQIASRVYQPGVTPPSDAGVDPSVITGELGVGPSGTAPQGTGWSWSPATFLASGAGQFGNDWRYTASTTAGSPGTYAYAYRYQYSGGPYTYCDTSGVSDGGTANLGVLTVNPPPNGNVQCALESLSAGAVQSGAPLTAVAHVYVASVTPGTGQGAGVITQVGVGAWSSTPPSGWSWQNAAYLDDSDAGATDRYTALLTPAYTGDRSVTFRVSVDDGGTWNYCDATQVPDGGYLAVKPVVDGAGVLGGVGWCNLQWPPSADGGTNTYGRAHAPGITDLDAGLDAGLVTAQLGYGPSAVDPGIGTAWTWTKAGFSTSTANDGGCSDCGNNYEYTLALPSADAGLSYAYRFTVDGGAWCFGDTGSSNDGFSGSQLGVISP